MNSTVYVSYLLQALGALLTAIILGGLTRAHRKRFLACWAAAWFGFAVLRVVSGVNSWLSMEGAPAEGPLRFSLSMLSGTTAYMATAWLLFGAAELTREGRMTWRVRKRWLMVAALLGFVVTLLYASDPLADDTRYMLRVGLRSLVAGVAFIVTAIAVWRTHETGEERGLGRSVVFGAFMLYGFDQLHFVWVAGARGVMHVRLSYAAYLGFFDFLLTFAIGLGVVIWLLEEERKATKELARRAEEMAFHDALTGLPNRQLFLDHLAKAIPAARRGDHKIGVFFVDLDRFKVINDSLGHAVGDKLLQRVADRLRNALRGQDTVARMGGDEFTILAPMLRSIEDAAHVAVKVQEAVRQPLAIDGRELFVSASIGISIFPDDGEVPDTLLKHADTAMSRATSSGADLFQLYTPEMTSHALEQLALEHALRRGLVLVEFTLHYQPIVGMNDCRIQVV